MQGKGGGPVNRVELESQVLCAALRQSLNLKDKIGAFTSVRELSHLFPDLLPPPEGDDASALSNKTNYYAEIGVRPQSAANGVIAAYLRAVRKFLKTRKVADDRIGFNRILNAGFVLRKPRLRLSHDLVVSRRWLHEESARAQAAAQEVTADFIPAHELPPSLQPEPEPVYPQRPAAATASPEPAFVPAPPPLPAAAPAPPPLPAAAPAPPPLPVSEAPVNVPPVPPLPNVAEKPAVPPVPMLPPVSVPPVPPLPNVAEKPVVPPVPPLPNVAEKPVVPPVPPLPTPVAAAVLPMPPLPTPAAAVVPPVPPLPNAEPAPPMPPLPAVAERPVVPPVPPLPNVAPAPSVPPVPPLPNAAPAPMASPVPVSAEVAAPEPPPAPVAPAASAQPAAVAAVMPAPLAAVPEPPAPVTAPALPSHEIGNGHEAAAHVAEVPEAVPPAQVRAQAAPAQPPAAAMSSAQKPAGSRRSGRISKEAAFIFDESQLRKPQAQKSVAVPVVVQLLEAAQIISAVEVQALMAQMEFAPNIAVEKHILNAGYVSATELASVKLGESLLQQGKITLAQFQVAIYDERTSGVRMAESLQVRGWLSVEVRNAIDDWHKKRQ